VKIETGSRIQLRVGSRTIMGVVEQPLVRRELGVRLTESLQGSVVVRWIDAEGDAWRTTGTAVPGDELTSVRLEGDWELDAMRASQRITGSRHSIRGEVQAGSLPPGTRLDFICLDLSASGCRMSGVGRTPQAGDLVKLALVHPWDQEREVLARAMRVAPLAFGRFEVGFRFEAEEGERAWLTDWRDAWSYVASCEDDEDTPDEPVADQAA
jgi:hypothetical protein